jgi:hypothetical protein
MTMDSDIEMIELGRELSLRQDFECAADSLMIEAAAHPRQDADSVLAEWAEVLAGQKHVLASAALRSGASDDPLSTVCTKGSRKDRWQEILKSRATGLAEAIQNRASLRRPFELLQNGRPGERFWILAASCPGVDPPSSLAVIVESCHSGLVYRMVEGAAIRAAVQLGSLTAARARATMAARISQMCSSSLQVAQLRLDGILHRSDPAQEMAAEIRNALGDLEEAQQGFDHARLLGIPWSRCQEDIPIGPLLAEIAEGLEGAAKAQVADAGCIDVLRQQDVKVVAARTRLSYALRDLLFGLWLLSGKSEPVRIGLRRDEGTAVLELTGGKPKLQTDVVWTGDNIGALLKDPEVFLTGPDEHQVERLIGFQLAWTLIEGMEGTLHAHLDGGKLVMTVRIPQPDRTKEEC